LVARARPAEVIGTARSGVERLALGQNARRDRIGMHGPRIGAADEAGRIVGRNVKRNDRAGERTRHRATLRVRRLRRQRTLRNVDRRLAVRHEAAQLALDVERDLARAKLGEIDAVAGTQAAHLAFIVRALISELALLVHKAVPKIDVGDAGALGARAIEIVKVARVGGRLRTTDRRQADPEHRNALALQRGDRFVDAFGINLGPLVAAKLDDTADLFAGLRRNDVRLLAFRIG